MRLVFVGVRFGQLVRWQVVIGETVKRRVAVQGLERVGVVDEQADRQVGVEFLQQDKVGGVPVATWPFLPRRRKTCISRPFRRAL